MLLQGFLKIKEQVFKNKKQVCKNKKHFILQYI